MYVLSTCQSWTVFKFCDEFIKINLFELVVLSPEDPAPILNLNWPNSRAYRAKRFSDHSSRVLKKRLRRAFVRSVAQMDHSICITKSPTFGTISALLFKSFQVGSSATQLLHTMRSGAVPPGHVPRTKEVVLLDDLIDVARPGEEVDVTGIFTHCYDMETTGHSTLPVIATILEGNHVAKCDLATRDAETIAQRHKQRILSCGRRLSIVNEIVEAIAPSIFGHTFIKRALALAMFGGCAKNVDGKHGIRGDVNVILLGDPGCAKSQLLRYCCSMIPRAVYTTGKGASAVGLTAGVHKDAMTKEWTLEGGALVLADNGICCFPAEDHQLLTSHGFLSLEQVLRCKDHHLQFASYDCKSKQLVYEHALRVIVKSSGVARSVVEITDHRARFCWAQGASNGHSDTQSAPMTQSYCQLEVPEANKNIDCELAKCSIQQQVKTSNDTQLRGNDISDSCTSTIISTEVSIVTTANHEIYAMPCHVRKPSEGPNDRFAKLRASQLAKLDPDACFKLMPHAENGAHVPESTKTRFINALFRSLGHDTEEKVIAFLEVYGFWLSFGALWSRSSGAPFCIDFVHIDQFGVEFLLERLRVCNVDKEFSSVSYDDGKHGHRVQIVEPRWLRLFFGEYEHKNKSANKGAIQDSRSNNSVLPRLPRKKQHLHEEKAEDDRTAECQRSFNVLDGSHDLPTYHADDYKPTRPEPTSQHRFRWVFSLERCVSATEMVFWRSRAATELPTDVSSSAELESLLRTALSTSLTTRTSVFAHIRSRYVDRDAQQSILSFFLIVVKTAHLSFLRPEDATREPAMVGVATRNGGTGEARQRPSAEDSDLMFTADEQVVSEFSNVGSFVDRSAFSITKNTSAFCLTANGLLPLSPSISSVSTVPRLQNIVLAANTKMRATGKHMMEVLTPEFPLSICQTCAHGFDVAREAQHREGPTGGATLPKCCGKAKYEVEDMKSAKVWWVLRFGKDRARAVIRGYIMANSQAGRENFLCNAFAKFREELVILALHAGYSARFRLRHHKHAIMNVGTSPDGRNIVTSNRDSGAVTCSTSDAEDRASDGDRNSYAEAPVLWRATDVHTDRSSGSMWCVSLPSTFVVVRRVKKLDGIVICASMPTIQSNCIDEFDKMNEQDRTSIHEAMEQQSISISKAGIVTSLRARCAVIAAANPISGQYDPSLAFSDNVELTAPILQRFDMLCVLQDIVDPIVDAQLAYSVVSSHQGQCLAAIPADDALHPLNHDTAQHYGHFTQDFLREYVVFARKFCHPRLHTFEQDKVSRLYADLRLESIACGGLPIAVRHLESLMRIAEAHAKMGLREYVGDDDVDAAIAILVRSFIASQQHSVRVALERGFTKYTRSDHLCELVDKDGRLPGETPEQHKLRIAEKWFNKSPSVEGFH
mmetsp:Transcript_33889/g.108425  ORF Transcript_33889/g.108425 Transcript_33889/m.108425 type:complete len:1392 (-) Transcript_33889:287-4462(-)